MGRREDRERVQSTWMVYERAPSRPRRSAPDVEPSAVIPLLIIARASGISDLLESESRSMGARLRAFLDEVAS